MAVFIGFLAFLGYGFDRFYISDGEFVFPIGTLAALGVGGFSAAASYYSGDRAVLLSTGAVPVERAVPGCWETALKIASSTTSSRMSIAAGCQTSAYVVPDLDLNARDRPRPRVASVAVTQGC
jgi:hypothetical protein